MLELGTKIYTIVATGIDIDKGYFPDPSTRGSYLSLPRAREELARMIVEEKAELDERYDTENRCEDFWEAYEDGYAAGRFSRLEILISELDVELTEGKPPSEQASSHQKTEHNLTEEIA